MPVINSRDLRVQEEANHFVSKKANNPKPCNHHKPSLEELQNTTFSDFVRNVVLKSAERDSDDASKAAPRVDRELLEGPPTSYNHGIAKVTLPPGFISDELVKVEDVTGRASDWAAEGTPIGNIIIPSPIKQCVRGIGGIYEFTFLDQPAIKVSEFRKFAEKYYTKQVGLESRCTIDELERKFWRRLGPTQEPSMYGADMNGSLFGEDECCGWNIAKMRSCLQLLEADQKDAIPGVTTPYLYFGMWSYACRGYMGLLVIHTLVILIPATNLFIRPLCCRISPVVPFGITFLHSVPFLSSTYSKIERYHGLVAKLPYRTRRFRI